MNRIILFTAAALSLLAAPALALDLQVARERQMVAEKADGYIVLVAKNNSEAAKLVKDVNDRRRSEYERISKENGQPVDIVARLAAKQIIAKLPAGARYQAENGAWETK